MNPIRHTDVFFDNLIAYNAGSRYIINQGSARSSKTYSILQLLYEVAKKNKPRVISVVSQTLPHLKRGAIRDFIDYLISTGQYEDKNWNRSSLTYIVNNSTIEFFSVDQPDKIYGAARDILFCNEVNSINEEAFRQLAIRTREKIFVDFNPTHEFYIISDYKQRTNATYIHSTFKKNPFLADEIIKELVEAGKRNANFQKVFVEGEVGSIEGVVFDNWEIGEFNNSIQLTAFGQDYGFSNDPTTLIKIAVDNAKHEIYIKELFYKKGLSTQQIYDLNKTYAGNGLIIADSAEPRLISELRRMGNNIREAEKGQGSVSAGLMALQDYKMIVSPESINIQNEFKNYVWLDGNAKLVIDDFNHTIDPLRYCYTFLNKHKGGGSKFNIPKYN
jgi:phage terminase large subunit